MDMAACREGRARVDDRRPRASAPCTGGARLGLAQPCGLCAARPGTVAMSPPRLSPCHPPLSWSPHHATNCYFKYGNMGHIRHPIYLGLRRAPGSGAVGGATNPTTEHRDAVGRSEAQLGVCIAHPGLSPGPINRRLRRRGHEVLFTHLGNHSCSTVKILVKKFPHIEG